MYLSLNLSGLTFAMLRPDRFMLGLEIGTNSLSFLLFSANHANLR